jgi:hypothetical protein
MNEPAGFSLACGGLLALALGLLVLRRPAAQAQAVVVQSLVLAGGAIWQWWAREQPAMLLTVLAALGGAVIALAAAPAASVGRNEDRAALLVGATLALLAIGVAPTLEAAGLGVAWGLGLATVLVGMAAAGRRGAAAQSLGLLTTQNGVALVALGMDRPWLAVAAAMPVLPGLVLLRRLAPR